MTGGAAPLRARIGGFTLLEAIVAMAIMATSLIALYGWLATSIQSIRHVQEQRASLADARTALAFMRGINPMETPSGERTVPPLIVRWTSTPATPVTQGMNGIGSTSLFDLALYDVDVTVLREDTPVRSFKIRLAGWVASRSTGLDAL